VLVIDSKEHMLLPQTLKELGIPQCDSARESYEAVQMCRNAIYTPRDCGCTESYALIFIVDKLNYRI